MKSPLGAAARNIDRANGSICKIDHRRKGAEGNSVKKASKKDRAINCAPG